MRRIDNIEDRADLLLHQIVKSGQRRDALLSEAAALVRDNAALAGSMRTIQDVRYQQLPQLAERSAQLARTIESSASLAERSSRAVKRLDALHARVHAAHTVAESMIAMQRTVAEVPAALAGDDLDKTVALLTAYAAAQQKLGRGGAASEDSSAATPFGPVVDLSTADPLIVEARRVAKEKLIVKATSAMVVNDKLTIMAVSKLLARLGFAREGRERYCNWMCDHTMMALQRIVARELKRMDSPSEASLSHLALVSQALDTVAAAYEAEEEFTRTAFGHEGPLLLLTLLHQRCTAECVPVLRDFIDKRKGALASLQRQAQGAMRRRQRGEVGGRRGRRHGRTAGGDKEEGNDDDDDEDDEDDEGNDDDDAVEAELLGLSEGLDGGEAAREAADARRADQTLEETSHLVSCCHVYLDFAEAQRAAHLKAIRAEAERAAVAAKAGEGGGEGASASTPEGAPAEAVVSAADRLWASDSGGGSNALLGAVQEILSMYVPLQRSYFEAAFEQALQLQLQSIREGAQRGSGGLRPGVGAAMSARSPSLPRTAQQHQHQHQQHQQQQVQGQGGVGSPASLMTGITSMYTAAVGGGEGNQRRAAIAAALEVETRYYLEGGAVTLPDDVFFFLRIAVHRALGTKSTQIASAVIMAATDVIQSDLFPEVARRAEGRRSMPGLTSGSGGAKAPPPLPTPRALRWACAGKQVEEYCRRLAQELRTITSSTPAAPSPASSGNFSSRDMLRFRELAQDMEIVARDVKEAQAGWTRQYAQRCVTYMTTTTTHLARLGAMTYHITEEAFYHFELNDPWVQAYLLDWATLLDYVGVHLHEPVLFDALLVEVARAVAKSVREAFLRKSFSTFGALQADKDVRALREFFFRRANEVTALRGVFAPLSLTSTLLLCDAPRDALEESHNTALTAEEKRAVLLLRADFKKPDVMALRL